MVSEKQKKHLAKLNKNQKGKNNRGWKGGRTKTTQGYILIKKRNHPNANKNGYVPEHHLVMGKRLGRYLKPEEVVHHINGKKDDNGIENLELMTKKTHMSHHSKERFSNPEYKKRMDEFLKEGRKTAYNWHKSKEGRKWHKEHFQKILPKIKEGRLKSGLSLPNMRTQITII